MKLLNNKKIQVIALFALILALLSLSVASDIVPGMNGTNTIPDSIQGEWPIIITGGNTTIFSISPNPSFDNVYSNTTNTGRIVSYQPGLYSSCCYSYIDIYSIFVEIYVNNIEESILNIIDVTGSYIQLSSNTNSIYINPNEISITGELIINNENYNTTIQGIKQMAFQVDFNSSSSNDLIPMPYDFYLNNVTTLLDNNTGYMNYTINQYTTYPTSKSEIININVSEHQNRNNISGVLLNRDNVVELVYNNKTNITIAVITFELLKK